VLCVDEKSRSKPWNGLSRLAWSSLAGPSGTRLEVVAGGCVQAIATLAREGVGLSYGNELGNDRAGRAVLTHSHQL
jgi:hypothetical protein